MLDRIENCAGCGEKPKVIHHHSDKLPKNWFWEINSPKCGLTVASKTAEGVIKEWNILCEEIST